MSENIQSKLFNGRLAWNNDDLAWMHLYAPEAEPEAPVEVLQLLVNDGQLELDYES
jgi:hypothetical protein